jgi:hypothetical protein
LGHYSGEVSDVNATTARFVVRGSITDAALGGTIIFDPSEGGSAIADLSGIIGDDRLLGEFGGSGDGLLFVGGIAGRPE